MYCAAQAKWREIRSVREAQAASLLPLPQAGSARRAGQDEISADPADYQSVLEDGLRFELTSAQSQMDRYRVEIEKKFSIAASCVVFALLGAPIALRFPRGGVGLTIGVSLGVFAIYYVGLLAGEAL